MDISRKPAAQHGDKTGLLRLLLTEPAQGSRGAPTAAETSLLAKAWPAIRLAVLDVSLGHRCNGRRAVELEARRTDADTARNILALLISFLPSKPSLGTL